MRVIAVGGCFFDFLCGYLEQRTPTVRVGNTISHQLKSRARYPKDLSWVPCCCAFSQKTSEELNIIIKSDVHGSAEAIKFALSNIKHDEVKTKILLSDIGMITESSMNRFSRDASRAA